MTDVDGLIERLRVSVRTQFSPMATDVEMAANALERMRTALTEIHGVTIGTGGPYTRLDMIRELAQRAT